MSPANTYLWCDWDTDPQRLADHANHKIGSTLTPLYPRHFLGEIISVQVVPARSSEEGYYIFVLYKVMYGGL